jgi:hypothetical protein
MVSLNFAKPPHNQKFRPFKFFKIQPNFPSPYIPSAISINSRTRVCTKNYTRAYTES